MTDTVNTKLIIDRLRNGRSKHWRELLKQGDWTRLLQIRHPEHERYRVYWERGFYERIPTMALKDFALEHVARDLEAQRVELDAWRERREKAERQRQRRKASRPLREGKAPTGEAWSRIGTLPGADQVSWVLYQGAEQRDGWIPVKLVRTEPARKANAWLLWSWTRERFAWTRDYRIMRKLEPDLVGMVQWWAEHEMQ